MRHGGGKAGGSGQTFSPAHRFLSSAFVADIAKHQHHAKQIATPVTNRCGAVFDRYMDAIFSHQRGVICETNYDTFLSELFRPGFQPASACTR